MFGYFAAMEYVAGNATVYYWALVIGLPICFAVFYFLESFSGNDPAEQPSKDWSGWVEMRYEGMNTAYPPGPHPISVVTSIERMFLPCATLKTVPNITACYLKNESTGHLIRVAHSKHECDGGVELMFYPVVESPAPADTAWMFVLELEGTGETSTFYFLFNQPAFILE